MNKTILKQGDCLELLKKIKDNSINLIVTDPPYLIDTTGGDYILNQINNTLKNLTV